VQSAVADRRSLWSRIRGVVARRDLLRALTWREVQVRYKQAFLGMAWAVFMPFSLMLVFTLLRSKMAPGAETDVPYPVWAYCGLLPWTMTQVALKGCTSSLVTNKNLLAKVYFPRELFPLAKIGAAAVDFCVGLTVLFGLMLYFKVSFTFGLLLLPVCLLLHVVMLFGLGLILSAANLFYRDVQYVFDVFVLIWMFASPVFLDPAGQLVVGGVDVLKTLNPLHPVLTAYRDALLHGGFQDPMHVAWGAVYALLLVLIGLLVFARWEPRFAERV
jgi:homopolymeric O-antigen transport system permease protein